MKMTQSRSDRSFPRYKQRLAVRFMTDDAAWRTGLTHDISPRGLFINCQRPAEVGTPLRIEAQVSEVGAISLSGHVAWVRRVPAQLAAVEHTGFAVQIENAPEEWFALCAELEARRIL